MPRKEVLIAYLLRLGDNALVLGQRLTEIVAAGPELEEELANANIALDYLGQARMFYAYAGELEGKGRTEDDFAYMREEREFRNLLLVEQPNGDFGVTMARQVLFDVFYLLQLEALQSCGDKRLSEIAEKSAKEIRYHIRHGRQWMLRLGDGTDESHRRITQAVRDLWMYTGEMFVDDELDEAMREEWSGPDLAALQSRWRAEMDEILEQATIPLPQDDWMADGGKRGQHTEHFGFLITELQYLQRVHPGLCW